MKRILIIACACVVTVPFAAGGAQASNFGRMFPQLKPFAFTAQQAADLVATEQNPTPDPAGTNRGTADDSATLPAEFT